ncbi:hypothetical protein E2K93_02255 [Thalassotalea sp. HSM 43]|uniref:hypothetical protein n=1 Tax=Thalassotalea sp. HSM 43 TaxID=2552945 RepID=UPI001080C7C0|nr:hypothetical protein [Thalassotalea sp. HSM 43]QBY03263.1 hypothetical protein E2K93_02255 [Thalassotalea sp. HSM 43]
MDYRNKIGIVALLTSSLLLSACSSGLEEAGPPPCNDSEILEISARAKNFVWGDPERQIFESKWHTVVVEQIEKKYQYLERKGLQDAVAARQDLSNFESDLQTLLQLNQQKEHDIKNFVCLASDAEIAGAASQNQSIEYILAALPDIYKVIEVKTAQIEASNEKR